MDVVCAWCGTTLSAEATGDAVPGGLVTHGICDACADAFMGSSGVPLERFIAQLDVPVLLVDGDVEVAHANPAALAALGRTPVEVLSRRAGEVIECVNSDLPGGCGRTIHCSGCVLRRTVTGTFRDGSTRIRVPATLDLRGTGGPERAGMLITTAKVGSTVLLKIEMT